jgi:hypothetical protein
VIFFGKLAIQVSVGGAAWVSPRRLAGQGFLARKTEVFQAQLGFSSPIKGLRQRMIRKSGGRLSDKIMRNQ